MHKNNDLKANPPLFRNGKTKIVRMFDYAQWAPVECYWWCIDGGYVHPNKKGVEEFIKWNIIALTWRAAKEMYSPRQHKIDDNQIVIPDTD